MTALITPVRHWMCPNCPLTEVTHEARPHTRFHACPGLRGLTAPMLPAGTRAKVEVVERQDYIGTEHAGPIMSVLTTRDDGQDVVVFAPTARATVRS